MSDPQRLSLTRGVLVAGVLVLLTQAPYAFTPGGASSDTWDDMPLWVAGLIAAAVVAAAGLALRVGLEILFLNRPADPAGIGLARPRRTVSSLVLFAILLAVVGPLAAVVTDLLGLLPDEEESAAPDAYSVFMAAAAIVVAPWAEELSIRGVLLSGLWGRLGFWPAAVLSSVAWAALHLQLGVIIMFGAAGVLLAWLRRRTGSILPGVAAHAAWNGLVTAVTFEAWLALPLLAAVLGSVVAAAVLMRRRPALIRRAVGGGVPPARRATPSPAAVRAPAPGPPGTATPPALAGAVVRSRFPAPALMGIVNVTPDSFSDGGLLAGTDEAIAHGARLAAEGAVLLDVGGESTRPGAAPVSLEEELRRVVPVVEGLVRATPAAVSVDTTKAEVARAAIAAGASFVNDVSALRADPAMADVVREAAVPVCLMHMQGEPRTMQDDPRYDDVVADVAAFLAARADEAIRRGIPADLICVDPGIGFGKTGEHNLLLLRHLDRIAALGYPVVVGASRKRFLGALTGVDEPSARVAGSVAAHVLAVRAGAWMLRVHDVAAHREALAVAAAIGAPAPAPAAAPADDTVVVEVRGLEVFAHHGVHDHERRDGQTFVFDIELAAPARAAATDDLRDAVDYSAVCDRVAALATERSYDLIERLADVVAHDLVERFGVARARVRVRKPQAPLAYPFEHVAAVAERSRSRSDEHSALLPGRQHARIVERNGRGTDPGGG